MCAFAMQVVERESALLHIYCYGMNSVLVPGCAKDQVDLGFQVRWCGLGAQVDLELIRPSNSFPVFSPCFKSVLF